LWPPNDQEIEVKRVFCTAALIALTPQLGSCGDFLTDSATRVANDLQKATEAMQGSSGATYILVHRPKASPEGCTHDYSFQLSRQSSMLMWCKSPNGERNVASHTTTSHLRYVDMPEQINLEKRAGEPITIELQKTLGKPVVVRAY
jgi:hypothetical protein